MKKILCLIFALLIPVFMFTGCSEDKKDVAKNNKAPQKDAIDAVTVKKGELPLGVYFAEAELADVRSSQIQIRDDSKIAIQFNRKTSTESGKYTIEDGALVANIEKSGCKYVFNLVDGKLVYSAALSSPSENFRNNSGIGDGTVFYLDHEYEAR